MSEERGRMSSVLGVTGLVLGNVQGQGDFEVRGRVQGDIVLSGRVLVAQGGLVLGTIEATQVTVSGTVRGDLIAEEGVEITGSGQVEGNVTSPRVAIESGARVRGHLRTGEESPVAVRGGQEQRQLERPRGEPLLTEPDSVEPSDVDRTESFDQESAPPGDLGEAQLEESVISDEPPARVVTPRAAQAREISGRKAPARSAPVEEPPPRARPPQPVLPPPLPPQAEVAREDGGEARAGGKRRRKRRRGGDRSANNDAPPRTDAAGTSQAHLDERPEFAPPPLRPTRPSGPLPPDKAGGKGPSPDGEPSERPRRGKRLPTFVKGARGHLRG